MSDDNDIIGASLGMVPMTIEPNTEFADKIDAHDVENSNFEEDAVFVKNNIKAILSGGALSISELKILAEQTQQPEIYDTIIMFMKLMLEANRDYLSVATKQEKDGSSKPKDGKGDTINNLVLTTDQVLDMMMSKKEEK